jgi:pimeloyl-ACP methyl ester carboxylesterase
MRKLMLILMMFVCVMSFAETKDVTVQGSMGKLVAKMQIPKMKSGKCQMVIIIHGLCASKDGLLERTLADSLEKSGIASIRFDFNGHGESDGDFQNMTIPNEIKDAENVYEYVRNLNFVGTVSLAGHSQGGVVASMVAGNLGDKAISRVVLLAPAAVLRDDVIRGSTFGVNYDPLNPPEFVQLLNNRKLGREYIRTTFSLPIYETAEKYQGPACLIHGKSDRLVPFTCSERYHHDWKGSELHLLDGFDHMFSQNPAQVIGIAVEFLARDETVFDASRMIREGKAECVLVKNGVIALTESGHGVSPLLNIYEKHKSEMAVATVVDKVIGRAAASIAICGKAKHVHGELMSEDAVEYLKNNGITVSYANLVPRILNRNRDGLCPLEQSVLGITDSAEALVSLKKRVDELQNGIK